MKKLIILACIVSSSIAIADELRLTRAEALGRGYVPVPTQKHVRKAAMVEPAAPHSLAWPVEFRNAAHTIGNSMAQYQEYGDGLAYWHGGDDLRVNRDAWVSTPVAGTLAGNHYSYVTSEDGIDTKYVVPWPKYGDSMYFEISVTTPEGFRFEFHHVNRDTLTPEVLAILNGQAPRQVPAGMKLGQVIHWPTQKPFGETYHHCHFNIIDAQGGQWNPEHYSPLIPDSTPPKLAGVYALVNGRYSKLKEGDTLTEVPDELVVANTDLKTGNSYVQPAVTIDLVDASGVKPRWDLTRRIQTPDGKYAFLKEHYLETMTTDRGGVLRTEGNYGNDFFLARVPARDLVPGPVEIRVGDQAGNITTFRLVLAP